MKTKIFTLLATSVLFVSCGQRGQVSALSEAKAMHDSTDDETWFYENSSSNIYGKYYKARLSEEQAERIYKQLNIEINQSSEFAAPYKTFLSNDISIPGEPVKRSTFEIDCQGPSGLAPQYGCVVSILLNDIGRQVANAKVRVSLDKVGETNPTVSAKISDPTLMRSFMKILPRASRSLKVESSQLVNGTRDQVVLQCTSASSCGVVLNTKPAAGRSKGLNLKGDLNRAKDLLKRLVDHMNADETYGQSCSYEVFSAPKWNKEFLKFSTSILAKAKPESENRGQFKPLDFWNDGGLSYFDQMAKSVYNNSICDGNAENVIR